MKFRSWSELVVWSSHPDRVRADCPQGRSCSRGVCVGPKLCGMCEDGIRADRVWEGLEMFGVGPNKAVKRCRGVSRVPVSPEDRARTLKEALARILA